MSQELFQKIDKCIERLSNYASIIASFLLILTTALIFIEVISRNFFHFSIYIADEYSGYMLIGIVFLGSAFSFRNEGFIAIELFYNRMPTKIKSFMNIVVCGISLVYLFILFWNFQKFTFQSYKFNITSEYITRTPMFIPHSLMAIGAILLIFEVGIYLIKSFKQLRDNKINKEI